MTLRQHSIWILIILADALDVATGVFVLLSVPTDSWQYVLAILTCSFYCVLAITNVILGIARNLQPRLYIRLSFAILGLIPLVLAAVTISSAILTKPNETIGVRFCNSSPSGACAFAGGRTIVTGVMLWFGTGIVQAAYIVLYVTGRSHAIKPVVSDQSGRTVSVDASKSSRQAISRFRYPLIRRPTEDEPFSFEDALKRRSGLDNNGHQSSVSESSKLSNATFIESHVSDSTQSRSWASTLPTATSEASPRSNVLPNRAGSQTNASSRRSSPGKSSFLEWGTAHSSPRHAARTDNGSLSNTHSSTSSDRHRPKKRPVNLKFHLPKSPSISGLDIHPYPELPSQHSSPRTPALTMTDDETGNDQSSNGTYPSLAQKLSPRSRNKSQQIHGLRLPFMSSPSMARYDLTQSINTMLPPPSLERDLIRKRASILDAIRPRLPDSRSFSRTSWTPRSAPSSPTRKSPRKPIAPAIHLDEAAFAEWDTSNIERDEYLLNMKDSRDISGGSSPFLGFTTDRRNGGTRYKSSGRVDRHGIPGKDDGGHGRDGDGFRSRSTSNGSSGSDIWQGRDVRVASDGSILAREIPDSRANAYADANADADIADMHLIPRTPRTRTGNSVVGREKVVKLSASRSSLRT